jgi:hypothetical protein
VLVVSGRLWHIGWLAAAASRTGAFDDDDDDRANNDDDNDVFNNTFMDVYIGVRAMPL